MRRGLNRTIRALLAELRRELERMYGPRLRRLVVFGSYARRQARPDSDLDVALVLDEFDSPLLEIHKTGQLVCDLSLKHGITVSLIPVLERELDSGLSSLAISIRAEGVPVS